MTPTGLRLGSLLSLLGLSIAAAGCPAEDEDETTTTASSASSTSGGTTTATGTTSGESTGNGTVSTTEAGDESTSSSTGDGVCPEVPKSAQPCDDFEAHLIECGWTEKDAYDQLIYCADDTYYEADQEAYYACISALDCADIGEFGPDPNGICDCHDAFK